MSTNLFTAMIVDDEPIAIEALKSGVDWAQIQISHILSANNVEDARRILEKNEVDILLCDIEMPGASGLELIEWLNSACPGTVCIFLTCHSEFTYAKQAVALGIFDYLLKPIDYDELTGILKKAVARRKELLSDQRARAVLSNLSHKTVGDNSQETSILQTIEKVKAYVIENISDETLDCKSVAQHVFLNPDYLSRLFKAQTDYSLKSYIIKTRMSLACELLINTDLSVSKIAMSCGYNHMAHFSKMFKQETNLTPGEYRSKYRK